MNVSNNYYSYVICILRLSVLKLWVSCIPVNLTVGLKKKKNQASKRSEHATGNDNYHILITNTIRGEGFKTK